MDLDRFLWTVDTDRIQPSTWWWWWWLMMVREADGTPHQLMCLWSTKNSPQVRVNDHLWVRKKPVVTTENGSTFDGMVAAWYFDGKKMREPFILREMDFESRRTADGGSLRPLVAEDLSFVQQGDHMAVTMTPTDGPSMEFRLSDWTEFQSRRRWFEADYTESLGYRILRIYGKKLEGTIGSQQVEGTAYFQKVTVNAPSPPWYWGMFHFSDGSYLDYFVPHIGPQLLRRGGGEHSRLDWGDIPLSKSLLFFDEATQQELEFDQVGLKKTFTPDGRPVFTVRAVGHDATLTLRAETSARATWRFEQQGYPRRILHYNEYPARLTHFVFDDGQRQITRDDYDWVSGNCEHTWGVLF